MFEEQHGLPASTEAGALSGLVLRTGLGASQAEVMAYTGSSSTGLGGQDTVLLGYVRMQGSWKKETSMGYGENMGNRWKQYRSIDQYSKFQQNRPQIFSTADQII